MEKAMWLGGVSLALFVICILYNKTVAAINGRQDDMGYVVFEVIAGVAGVLIFAIPIVGLEAVLYLFILFSAAGLPMTAGYIKRHRELLQRDREIARQAVEEKLDVRQAQDRGV